MIRFISCGDDANEFWKPDYHGGECIDDVNECVWSTGDAQPSNTGNEWNWCYLHEWNICNEADLVNTVPIGTKAGDIAGGNYVTCVGVAGSQKWTITSDILPENDYGPTACSDGIDNDGDTFIDQDDQPDCCTIINRECKQYTQNEFDIIHTTRQTPLWLRNIQKIVSNIQTRYYACVPDDTDTACCINPNSCVYDSVCYDDRVKLDVDGDGITEVCVASSPGEWMDEFELECTDSIDNDFDGKTDCEDEDCSGSLSGNVQDADTADPISEARIDVTQATTVKNTADTNNLGNYHIGDVLCTYNIGAYDMIASKTDYVSSTQNVELVPREDLTGVDFTLTLGTSCEDDCTYAGDNIIHKECDGIDNDGEDIDGDGDTICSFSDDTAKEVCDLAQPGWIRDYPLDKEIECAEGTPQAKSEIEAGVTCDEENLIKTTKLVNYKGKLVKLVIVTCG